VRLVLCCSAGSHSQPERSGQQHLATSSLSYKAPSNRQRLCASTLHWLLAMHRHQACHMLCPPPPAPAPLLSCPQAVDKATLVQLRGRTAIGYAFDRRYGPDHTSDSIYDDCVASLVENLFKVRCGVRWGGRGGGCCHAARDPSPPPDATIQPAAA
jgi:hypothetical protein